MYDVNRMSSGKRVKDIAFTNEKCTQFLCSESFPSGRWILYHTLRWNEVKGMGSILVAGKLTTGTQFTREPASRCFFDLPEEPSAAPRIVCCPQPLKDLNCAQNLRSQISHLPASVAGTKTNPGLPSHDPGSTGCQLHVTSLFRRGHLRC